ncbi:hypothetical protein L6452_12963 [Arctium lappa]|uniref:Uncharacterized protein n=1 Tax=Arctium lappa TaxID=4217 RepID=A0ACB9CH68_ARCLA|nr:hypothetical protein L6452_12963 [Arctium lappa]
MEKQELHTLTIYGLIEEENVGIIPTEDGLLQEICRTIYGLIEEEICRVFSGCFWAAAAATATVAMIGGSTEAMIDGSSEAMIGNSSTWFLCGLLFFSHFTYHRRVRRRR